MSDHHLPSAHRRHLLSALAWAPMAFVATSVPADFVGRLVDVEARQATAEGVTGALTY